MTNMTYSIERTYNLESRLRSSKFAYENLKLRVEGATSAEEAEREVTAWAENIITAMQAKMPKEEI